jgi:hypothetical protein
MHERLLLKTCVQRAGAVVTLILSPMTIPWEDSPRYSDLPAYELEDRRHGQRRYHGRPPFIAFWLKRVSRHLFHWSMALLGILIVGWICFGGVLLVYGVSYKLWPDLRWHQSNYFDEARHALPIACHSHNDYLRPRPLFTALSNGCTSIEADVWLWNDMVLVGHTEGSLSVNRTLASLYIDPLLHMLEKKLGSGSPIESLETAGLANEEVHGVFDADPSISLILLIDFKTDDTRLWHAVQKNLDPLRRKNLLTYINGTETIRKPITVVLSGEAPFDNIVKQRPYRDIFFDAPLEIMAESSPYSLPQMLPEGANDLSAAMIAPLDTAAVKHRRSQRPTNADVYSQANSYYASASFRKTIGRVWHAKLTEMQLGLIREQVKGAHARGLKVRYWGVPAWPKGVRNYLWRVLIREGVDVLSVDDVSGVAKDNWGPRKGGCAESF